MKTAFLRAGNIKELGRIYGQVDEPGSPLKAFPDAVKDSIHLRKPVLCIPEGDVSLFTFQARSIYTTKSPERGTLWTCIIEVFSGDSPFQLACTRDIPVVYMRSNGIAELHCEDRLVAEVSKVSKRGVTLEFLGGETRQFQSIEGAHVGKVLTLRRTVKDRLIVLQDV
ncbi:MAG TPA: hypothetical protein VJ841_03155 [Candidatus Saccharimonadales bacterium]|nr:hypothetical protein [Candidatus Saccharimonadales bacterium]